MLIFRPILLFLASTRKFLHLTHNSDNTPVSDDANMMVISKFKMSAHCSLKLLTICYIESSEREKEGVIRDTAVCSTVSRRRSETSSAVIFFRMENVLSAAVCKVKNELSISKLCCFSVKDFYYVVHQQISAHDIFEND